MARPNSASPRPSSSTSTRHSSSPTPRPNPTEISQGKATTRKLPSHQPTITSVIERSKMMPPSHPRSENITKLIAEMICVDCQPFSIVENAGFRRLINYLEPRYVIASRKSLSAETIPLMYDKVVVEVKKLLILGEHVSITTDMWTSTSNADYLSVTAHFISTDFVQYHVSLDVIPFTPVSHTAENISDFITTTLEEWGIMHKLNLIVRDNARNYEAAMTKGSFSSIPCIAHTLQLVVKDGCFNKKEFTTVIAVCRRIVGHFKHSAKATKLLKSAQKSLGIPGHKLIQDEPTRWNSTYSLLVRLIEQRKALTCVMHDLKVGNDLTLSSSNWALIESMVEILKVFFDVTKTVSAANVTVSEVIPIVNAIKVSLRELHAFQTTGTKAIINDMIVSLETRYTGYESKPCYAIATLLNPRFKLQIFSCEDAAESAKVKLLQAMERDAYDSEDLNMPNPHEMERERGNNSTDVSNSKTNPMKSLYRKMLASGSNTRTVPTQQTFADELQEYLMEPLLDDEENGQEHGIMAYWSTSKFQTLKKYARNYLGSPPATVFSERLFSTPGIICDRKRSRLDTERVRQLVFLCKNLPLVKYCY